MKTLKIISFLFLLITHFSAYAQSKSKKLDSIIVIEYNETNNLPDFSNNASRKLIIDGNASYYFISNLNYVMEDQVQPTASIIKYKDSNYLLFNRPMMPQYGRFTYFKDSLTPMKWLLTNKKDSINGRLGYEAKTFFRGRLFTAYYDPTIPISDGPMKFNGLPGLIIKLYDSDKLWDFTFLGLSKTLNNYKVNNIEVAGDYKIFKSIFPAWDKKIKEKNSANKNIDPNCVGCKSAPLKSYPLEIIE